MRVRRVLKSLVGSVGASLLSFTAMLGACDSTEEQLRALEVGGRCVLDSECEGDLVCVFEHCHVECDEDKDCKDNGGGRCVRVPQDDREQSHTVGVCQLPTETECEIDDDCKGKQVCAPDLECRDLCSTPNPCFDGFVCAASGQCAWEVELDAKGELGAGKDPGTPGGGGAGGMSGDGQSGAAGSGGATSVSSGGSTTTGGAKSTGGSQATGGDGSAGDNSMGGGSAEGGSSNGGDSAGGSNGAGGDSANGGIIYDYSETADGVELVENNDYDHAIPIEHRIKVRLGGTDQDWFALTPPKDGLTHIVSVRLEQDTPLSTQMIVVSQTDFSQVGSAHFDAGVTSFAYVTVGPNTTMLFGFVRYSIQGSAGFADVTFDVVAENDSYEPNNTKETAHPIALGTNISGQILNPYVSEIDRPLEDWFQVELQVGPARVQFLDTPDEGGLTMNRRAPDGSVKSVGSAPVGGTATHDFDVTQAGTHLLQIVPNTSNANTRVVGFSSKVKPAYLDQQYTFVITQ